MEKENFTAGRVATYAFKPSANCKSNQTIYWDAKTPGLCLRKVDGFFDVYANQPPYKLVNMAPEDALAIANFVNTLYI